jgi:ribosomal protein L29
LQLDYTRQTQQEGLEAQLKQARRELFEVQAQLASMKGQVAATACRETFGAEKD